MKVLVVYFSQTGNTEKVARAISDEASNANDVDLKKIEDVGSNDIAEYDFIFLGSPIHGGNFAAPVKEWLGSVQAGSDRQMAGFCTHAAPSYPEQSIEQFAEPIITVCKEKGLAYKGCFDCQGVLAEQLRPKGEEGQTEPAQTDDHPNDEDVANAKEFARNLLG